MASGWRQGVEKGLGRALGQPSPGAALQKMSIWYENQAEGMFTRSTVMFNPNTISRSRSIKYEDETRWQSGTAWHWADSTRHFVAVDPEKLTLSLFFDTNEAHDDPSTIGQQVVAALQTANPFASSGASDVREKTVVIERLAAVDTELHRPPICKLRWGSNNIFIGVLTKLDQKLTMFLPDGTPVRAIMNCTFKEYETQAHAHAFEMHSADVIKTHIVQRGDTLQSVAAAHYGDPTKWRNIARANGIINPRQLRPGTALTVPKLDR